MKHGTALVAIVGLTSAASAATIPMTPREATMEQRSEINTANYDQVDKREPLRFRGGKGKTTTNNNNNGGGSFLGDVTSGIVSGGILAGADALLNPQEEAAPVQRRDPKFRLGGSSKPKPATNTNNNNNGGGGGGGGGFLSDVASGVVSGGIIAGAESLLTPDQAAAPAKRDPKFRLGGSSSKPKPATNTNSNGGGGGGFLGDVASGVVSGGILAGADALLNPQEPAPVQRRDPKFRLGGSSSSKPKPATNANNNGGGAGGFASDVLSGVVSGGIVAGAESLLTPDQAAAPAKRDPKFRLPKLGGGGSSSGGGVGGFLGDVAGGVASGGILAGADALLNPDQPQKREEKEMSPTELADLLKSLPDDFFDTIQDALVKSMNAAPQKRDPEARGGRFRGFAKDFGKDVAADVVSGGIVAGAGAAIDAASQPQKRDPEPAKKTKVKTAPKKVTPPPKKVDTPPAAPPKKADTPPAAQKVDAPPATPPRLTPRLLLPRRLTLPLLLPVLPRIALLPRSTPLLTWKLPAPAALAA
ncbi:hypothetical protein B0T17DRAFT_129814 [Bombardia bombarda]|uniref:Uncharacterized protein n=1 Tax=Bombardia bombarda TaxID=252184 RepID=A0AA39TLP5_9PEZI|nr:hypothetical protein B0T17DRAFT_129814 [Bombardia bombarda]